jgi:hypothetical protein
MAELPRVRVAHIKTKGKERTMDQLETRKLDDRHSYTDDEYQRSRERYLRQCDRDHLANLGHIVFVLADHTPGHFGNCNPNDEVANIIDLGRPAHELALALANMSAERAAGIVRQLDLLWSRREEEFPF